MINADRFLHVLEHEFSLNCNNYRKAEGAKEKENVFHYMEVLEEITKFLTERFPDIFNGEDIEIAYTVMKEIDDYIRNEQA